MKKLTTFIIASAVFEIIALVLIGKQASHWILDAIVALVLLYLAVMALAGWRKQVKIDLPQVQKGRIVKKRHWRMF
ncbi:hypothetical protein [Alicyclobacillus sp. SO9]|uniref:hypothetical protein n=1 Tax=Alicyclobacillus sp. SO9 TaxID=2665646 RepID=UPI0018E70CE7|nr:hypothetical protein [Alicyclobacillus sp. SO9]QQE80781.1 hypothetical protein GI364_10585 [Alicyclobacillus sp. SO9]